MELSCLGRGHVRAPAGARRKGGCGSAVAGRWQVGSSERRGSEAAGVRAGAGEKRRERGSGQVAGLRALLLLGRLGGKGPGCSGGLVFF